MVIVIVKKMGCVTLKNALTRNLLNNRLSLHLSMYCVGL